MAKVQADAVITFAAAGHDKVIGSTKGVGDQFQRTAQKVNKTTKTMHQQFRFMRGGLGQFGHQIQDVAVQLQSGQNAMLVFGQQGSQIASLFGPQGAVIGAVLAVGAAIATSMVPSLFEGERAFEELEGQIKETAKAFGNLTEAQRLAIAIQRRQEIAKLEREQAKLSAEMRDTTAALNDQSSELISLNNYLPTSGRNYASVANRIDALEAKLKEQAETLGLSAGQYDTNIRLLELLRKELQGIEAGGNPFEEATEGATAFGEAVSATTKARLAAAKATADLAKYELDELASADAKKKAAAEAATNARLVQAQTLINQTHLELDAIVEAEKLKRKAREQTVNYTEAALGDLAAMMKEGSAEQKALLVAEQGMRVVSATMAAFDAANKATAAAGGNPAVGAAVLALGLANAGAIAGQAVASFEGGGMTPRGIRSGGMDGKGGMMAVLHPNEKVTDMERGGDTQPVNVTFNIQAHDASGFDALLAKRRGMIVGMVNRAMNERGKRGVVT